MSDPGRTAAAVLDVDAVMCRLGGRPVLEDVSFSVHPGQVHALIGPNGAGKTTMLRTITGLVDPERGSVAVRGGDREGGDPRHSIGFIPSGDRTFYLRLSAVDNLVFFARLHGQRRRPAIERAREVLDQVGLGDVGDRPVGAFSHGMHKRLSVARALQIDPPLLLVDEATHDLDPVNARRVLDLVADRARLGAAVLWTTQRLEELRGFADSVSVLVEGRVRFAGTVPELAAVAVARDFVLHLRGDRETLSSAVSPAELSPATELGRDHARLRLPAHMRIGEAVSRLEAAGGQVLGCAEERSRIESAFLQLAGEDR